jgi:tetratricopeptide (TPR) repeat protein
MAALLVLYLVLVGLRAIAFLGTGQPLGIGIGVALLVLPVLGAWALVRELLFGARSARLLRTLAEEGGLPGGDLPRRPSGRVERGAADAAFQGYADAVERDPEEWRAWLRLGLAYDASGDRRRARAAVRRAIALARR